MLNPLWHTAAATISTDDLRQFIAADSVDPDTNAVGPLGVNSELNRRDDLGSLGSIELEEQFWFVARLYTAGGTMLASRSVSDGAVLTLPCWKNSILRRRSRSLVEPTYIAADCQGRPLPG